MEDSTKRVSKMVGTQNAETAVHLCMYMRYISHYVYQMGKKTGLVQKPPEAPISPQDLEMIEVFTNKVSREIVSVETSTYHGKVLPLEHAEALVSVTEDIEIRDLSESIIPYPIARDIVLEDPGNIAVAECACRSLQNDPCRPLDVCLMVGEPFTSFVVDNKVMNARKITSDEAVEILRAEHKRGHVHGAFFKDVADGRFYAICNCCPCCCLGMQAWNKLRLPMICASGYCAEVSQDCTGCGDCAEICPFFAIEVDDVAVVDRDKCMGCGVCEGACESEAMALVLDPTKGEPLDIRKLIEERRV